MKSISGFVLSVDYGAFIASGEMLETILSSILILFNMDCKGCD